MQQVINYETLNTETIEAIEVNQLKKIRIKKTFVLQKH